MKLKDKERRWWRGWEKLGRGCRHFKRADIIPSHYFTRTTLSSATSKMNQQQEQLVLRGKIVALREAGHTIAGIARELGISEPTVRRTVRRPLHEAGIHHRTPAIKEKLEDRHRTARLQFAQQHEGEGIDFWGITFPSTQPELSDDGSTNSQTYNFWSDRAKGVVSTPSRMYGEP
ncbi:putative Transposable element Tc1 transposase-like 61 [Homarus americanus]|uniref:Putative Transposable element Tc1 transposase-like 61 n=1 Tax=Homarus americanus TaxID=6706 RepID=A0A8J5JEG4_HOMAM|nr:putative Transposable element Tc1 transposase-like 61 [Homarus americanus]